jgi:hypothetical protein
MSIRGGRMGAADDDRDAKATGYVTRGAQSIRAIGQGHIHKRQIWAMSLGNIHRFLCGPGDATNFVAELLHRKGKAQDDELIIFRNEKSQIARHSVTPHPCSTALRFSINPDAARLCLTNNVRFACRFAIVIPV